MFIPCVLKTCCFHYLGGQPTSFSEVSTFGPFWAHTSQKHPLKMLAYKIVQRTDEGTFVPCLDLHFLCNIHTWIETFLTLLFVCYHCKQKKLVTVSIESHIIPEVSEYMCPRWLHCFYMYAMCYVHIHNHDHFPMSDCVDPHSVTMTKNI